MYLKKEKENEKNLLKFQQLIKRLPKRKKKVT